MNVSYMLVFWQFFCLFCLFLPLDISGGNIYISSFFMILAVLLFLWVLLHNKLGNFNIIPDIKDGCKLVVTGPYKFVRHPMYTGVILVALSAITDLYSSWKFTILALLILVLYFKAKREEDFWCVKTDDYKEFKKGTKMFIPFVL